VGKPPEEKGNESVMLRKWCMLATAKNTIGSAREVEGGSSPWTLTKPPVTRQKNGGEFKYAGFKGRPPSGDNVGLLRLFYSTKCNRFSRTEGLKIFLLGRALLGLTRFVP